MQWLLRGLFALLVCCAPLVGGSTALAADAVIAPDPGISPVPGFGGLTALGGTIVWVSGPSAGAQRLMERTPTGVIVPVAGAAPAFRYVSPDLGRDRAGRLVLTYSRCNGTPGRVRCVSRRDDLRGHSASFPGLAPKGCTVGPVAVWRARTAYSLFCVRAGRVDDPRSGLYVKSGTRAARRLALPAGIVKARLPELDSIDLRGRRVGGIACDCDISFHAFAEDLDGRNGISFPVAASDGDSSGDAPGLALGPAGTLWALAVDQGGGSTETSIMRASGTRCIQSERLVSPPGDERPAAVDLAVDGQALYLASPGIGITEHQFAPERPC
jgi:hypothetical protein